MDSKKLYGVVQRVLLSELARHGESFVPVSSSNRHCHLSRADADRLFGPGHELTPIKELVQPGQYAAAEKVTMKTEKGSLTLRVVGPLRKETQVELSFTDAVKVGLNPPVRMSGELENSPGCILENGHNSVAIPRGVIVAARHLHLAPDEAEAFGVKDHDVVSLQVEGQRGCVLNNVIVRSGTAHAMEAHIDRDEANACGIRDGQLCRVIKAGGQSQPQPQSIAPAPQPQGGAPVLHTYGEATAAAPGLHTYTPPAQAPQPAPAPRPEKNKMLDLSTDPHALIGEETVLAAARDKISIIRYGKGAIITPLARDMASSKGIILSEKPD